VSLRARLAPFTADPSRACVLLDFDGTLASIVDDPAQARPLPAVVPVLARLVGRIGRVAVVSGRPVAFLQAAFPIEGLILVGQYGLEHLEDGRVVTHPAASAAAEAVEAAARQAETELPGLAVERKGVAVTLHWRTAPQLADAARRLGRHLAQVHGLVAAPGRLALELRPAVPVDKGTAARRVVRGCRAALVAGDDVGDVAMFTAIGQLLAADELGYGLRIAVRSAEAPDALLEAADEVVAGPHEVCALLDTLAAMAPSPPQDRLHGGR
jgi:trehalose 6-phosphate phosphatase